jgi:hypothetical protein
MNYFLFVLLVFIATAIWRFIRNNQVLRFRNLIIDVVSEAEMHHIDSWKYGEYGWNFYKMLPEYDKMLYSLKPLRLSAWASKDDINHLLGMLPDDFELPSGLKI